MDDLCLSLPEPVEQQAFIRQGYVQLKGLWSEGFAEALSNEARCVMLATPRRSEPPGEHVLIAPLNRVNIVSAPLLFHLHLSLVPLARALAGRVLIQAHAWYNFYENDDDLWLHVDTDGSELVFLTTAFGDVGPLHLHPDLRGKTQDELEAIRKDPKWKPETGVPISYPRLGLLAHRGNVIPHHRPGRSISEPCAVAALHYASLF